MAPLICWSFSSSMLRYLFVDHAVPAMWRSLAAARSVRERAHDTVRRRISRRMRSRRSRLVFPQLLASPASPYPRGAEDNGPLEDCSGIPGFY
jgi:hypothetical protein